MNSPLLQIYRNKISASLQPMELLLLFKDFRIDFRRKFHDNLNSIVAGFNINQNLWVWRNKNNDKKL